MGRTGRRRRRQRRRERRRLRPVPTAWSRAVSRLGIGEDDEEYAAEHAGRSRGDVRTAASMAMAVTGVGVAGLAGWVWIGAFGLLGVAALVAVTVRLYRRRLRRILAEGATWGETGEAFAVLVIGVVLLADALGSTRGW